MARKRVDFLSGTLDQIVLKLLQAGPANGLELTRSIQALSKEVLAVNYGSLYPALHRAETRGWITAEWRASENNRRARYYRLTSAGLKQLREERDMWKHFSTALELILRAQ